ncbi:MAG TPA: hypothetical protein ENN06_02095 [Desulfobacteraceae bacterium]|nr:hypothetical protein [Desulfobacteraceae bacterium]
MNRMTAIGLALVFGLVCSAGQAMDYGNMTNEELAELRGAILNAPEAERRAFENEWEKRLPDMSEEEKERFADREGADPGKERQGKQPHIQGRGYDEQGMGTVIHGGGGPLPPDVLPGAGR